MLNAPQNTICICGCLAPRTWGGVTGGWDAVHPEEGEARGGMAFTVLFFLEKIGHRRLSTWTVTRGCDSEALLCLFHRLFGPSCPAPQPHLHGCVVYPCCVHTRSLGGGGARGETEREREMHTYVDMIHQIVVNNY